MTLYKRARDWLCRNYPGLTGAHSYYGVRVYFPKGSFSSRVVRARGAFESDNVRLLQGLVRADTWLFDVGTNIGLMSVPVLAAVKNSRVVSFEPSPNVLPFLRRTRAESPYVGRWILVPKAIGAKEGPVVFNLSAQKNSEFDGVKHTGRVPTMQRVEVEMSTIDTEWRLLGMPNVSVIKCDVEGAELDVLRGGLACLEGTRPFVLLEWNRQNFEAYDLAPGALLELATDIDFFIFTVPHFIRVKCLQELKLHMTMTENFLLAPCEDPVTAGPKAASR